MPLHSNRSMEQYQLLAETRRIAAASRQATLEFRAVNQRVEAELARARAVWDELQAHRGRLRRGSDRVIHERQWQPTPTGPQESEHGFAERADPGLLTLLQRTALKHCMRGGTLAKFGLKGIPAEDAQEVLACSVHTVKSLERRHLVERAGPGEYRLTGLGLQTARAL